MQSAERLKHVRHIALDLDGTVYRGRTVFPQVEPFLATLAELRIGHSFVTNNSSRTKQEYVRHLLEFGISASATNIYTSTDATIAYLRKNMPEKKRLFVLGPGDVQAEIAQHGFSITEDDPQDEPDAVLVAFDTELSYQRLCRASYWIEQGKPFIATHPDRFCPTDEPTLLVDCGSICALIEQATGRKPDAVPGKPDRRMLEGLMRQNDLRPSQVAMVGDRLYTDMAMARDAGVIGVLVLTGETTADQLSACSEKPDFVVDDLGVLGRMLKQCQEKHSFD